MRRNLFKPYTKEQVVQILRHYFTLSVNEANSDAERLGACVVRDNLDAVKYIRKWEAQLRAGKRGNIKELYALYPANNPFMAMDRSVKRQSVVKPTVTKAPVKKQTVVKPPVKKQVVAKSPVKKQAVAKQPMAKPPVKKQSVAKQSVAKQGTKKPFLQRPLEMPKEKKLVDSMLAGAYMRDVKVGSVDWESDTAGAIMNLRLQCVLEDKSVVTVFWSEVPFTRYEDAGDWCIDFDEDSGLEDFIYSHKEIMPTFGDSWRRLMTKLT